MTMKVKAIEKKLKFTKDPNDPGSQNLFSGLTEFTACPARKRGSRTEDNE